MPATTRCKARHDDNFSEYERRLLDEGLFGADFLVRLKRPNGSFFESIDAPGPAKLAKDRKIGNPNWRTQIKTKRLRFHAVRAAQSRQVRMRMRPAIAPGQACRLPRWRWPAPCRRTATLRARNICRPQKTRSLFWKRTIASC